MASPILVDHFLRQYAFKVTNSLLAIAEDDQDTYAIDPINVAEFWYKHAETDEARDKATAAIASMLSAINTVGDATEIIIDWEQIKILVEIIQSSPTALTDDELLAKPEYAVLFDVGDDGRLIGNDDVKAQCQRKARQWGRILGYVRRIHGNSEDDDGNHPSVSVVPEDEALSLALSRTGQSELLMESADVQSN